MIAHPNVNKFWLLAPLRTKGGLWLHSIGAETDKATNCDHTNNWELRFLERGYSEGLLTFLLFTFWIRTSNDEATC
jgi:hypothetical protein